MQKALLSIHAGAHKLGIPDRYFEPLGPFSGKVRLELLDDPPFEYRQPCVSEQCTARLDISTVSVGDFIDPQFATPLNRNAHERPWLEHCCWPFWFPRAELHSLKTILVKS